MKKEWNVRKVGDINPSRVIFFGNIKVKGQAVRFVNNWNSNHNEIKLEVVATTDNKNWERA